MEYLEAFTLIQIEFWTYLAYFFIAVLIAWTIPGILILQKLNTSIWKKLIVATCVGIVMWGWQAWIFGLLHIRWASFIYLGVMLIGFSRYSRKIPRFHKPSPIIFNLAAIIIMLVGVAAQQLPLWHQGIRSDSGIGFCCEEPIDGLWNIAVTDQLVRAIPPETPGYSGTPFINYHFWSYLITADLIRVFHLPLLPTQLQFMPLFISVTYGLVLLSVGSLWLKTKTAFQWLLFWTYFAADFFPIARMHVTGSVDFNLTPLLSSWMFSMNFPMSISIVLLLAAIFIIAAWEKQRSRSLLLLAAFMCGTVIGYKVHTGIFVLLGLLALAVLQQRKQYTGLFFASVVIAAVLYLPQNHGSGGLYISWFSRIAEFASLPELGYSDSVTKTINFPAKQLLQMPFRHTVYYLFSGMFLTGLYLMTYFGFYSGVLLLRKKDFLEIPKIVKTMIIPAILISLILGVFTQQASGGGHTYNFIAIVYWIMPLMIIQLFLPEGLYHRSAYWRVIMLIFVTVNCVRLVPQMGAYLRDYDTRRWFIISHDELTALTWAREHLSTNTLLFVDTENRQDAIAPYVSIFSQKPAYYSGRISNLAHNVQDAEKWELIQRVYSDVPCEQKKQSLGKYPNAVLYIRKQNGSDLSHFSCMTPRFANGSVMLLQ